MFTLSSTVWLTARQIRAGIEFSSRHQPGGGACFATATLIIPSAKEEKSCPPPKICLLSSENSWTGIRIGPHEQSGKRPSRIPCCDCAVQANGFGPANTLMTMCDGYARDGNEPYLLGHEYLHLSVRRSWRPLKECGELALEDACARRSIADVNSHRRRSTGETAGEWRHGTLHAIRGRYQRDDTLIAFRSQGGQGLCVAAPRSCDTAARRDSTGLCCSSWLGSFHNQRSPAAGKDRTRNSIHRGTGTITAVARSKSAMGQERTCFC